MTAGDRPERTVERSGRGGELLTALAILLVGVPAFAWLYGVALSPLAVGGGVACGVVAALSWLSSSPKATAVYALAILSLGVIAVTVSRPQVTGLVAGFGLGVLAVELGLLALARKRPTDGRRR
ncbi:hypothetical protein [Natrononativus amylolyticus]|uniref:hypothetical protein n=1 Tax=Natrononativus amylolyticus TaxID=2963434 RepID=UPI0020CE0E87|nr:hypothetical protein [Natrononativus amylolyticus]